MSGASEKWYSAKDLADAMRINKVPGFPTTKQGWNKWIRALPEDRVNEASRKRVGELGGGGLEYRASLFPVNVRIAIGAGNLATGQAQSLTTTVPEWNDRLKYGYLKPSEICEAIAPGSYAAWASFTSEDEFVRILQHFIAVNYPLKDKLKKPMVDRGAPYYHFEDFEQYSEIEGLILRKFRELMPEEPSPVIRATPFRDDAD